jgi:hypothetical protein
MSTPNENKINQTLQKAVPGSVMTTRWLAELGVSKDLARKYVASGWLERIGRGAYRRTGDTVDWQGALFSLQTQLGMNVHVAALSALKLKGQAHYLPAENESVIQLFSDRTERLPFWFFEINRDLEISHRCVRLFGAKQFPISSVQYKGFSFRVSPPERAALEMLYCMKSNSDFDSALEVFSGLGTLRPAEVQQLLEACESVRVKRTFLWMANACNHSWARYLTPDKMDLGSGKRMVYRGGMLDSELMITVPKNEEHPDV